MKRQSTIGNELNVVEYQISQINKNHSTITMRLKTERRLGPFPLLTHVRPRMPAGSAPFPVVWLDYFQENKHRNCTKTC